MATAVVVGSHRLQTDCSQRLLQTVGAEEHHPGAGTEAVHQHLRGGLGRGDHVVGVGRRPRASRSCSATRSGGRDALLVMNASRIPCSRAAPGSPGHGYGVTGDVDDPVEVEHREVVGLAERPFATIRAHVPPGWGRGASNPTAHDAAPDRRSPRSRCATPAHAADRKNRRRTAPDTSTRSPVRQVATERRTRPDQTEHSSASTWLRATRRSGPRGTTTRNDQITSPLGSTRCVGSWEIRPDQPDLVDGRDAASSISCCADMCTSPPAPASAGRDRPRQRPLRTAVQETARRHGRCGRQTAPQRVREMT